MLDTPRPPLAVTADKAYDSEKVRQQIKDEGVLPVIPSRSTATKKAYLRGDNQDERAASIRMRMRRGRADGGRA